MSNSLTRRRFLGQSIVATAALACGGRLGAQALPDRVKIGAVGSISGGAAAFVRPGVNAWQLAVDNLNASGGLWGGGKGLIDLEVLDDKTTPAAAVENVGRLASDATIPLIMSATATPSTLQASVEAERRQLPFVNTASTEPTINTRGLVYVLSTSPTARMFAIGHLQDTRKIFDAAKIQPKRVGFVYENKLAGPSVKKVWDETAGDILRGWNIVDYFGYDPASKDLSPLVAQLKSANIDLLIPYGYPQDSILLIQTMRSLKFEPLAITGPFGGIETTTFAQALGKGANYIMGAGYYAPDIKIAENAKFVAQYQQKFGAVPDGVAASCFQGAHAVFKGLRAARSTDRAAVLAAMRTVSLAVGDPGIVIPPGIRFDQRGANELARPVYYQWLEGKKQTLLPAEYATATPTIPRPSWAEIG